MQMNEQVLTALEVLRNFAENDFERHRIDVLEQDLTAPPKVEIIDDKHQKFNGMIFRKAKGGHYENSFALHRSVWQYYNGEVPEGDFVIHHLDEDKDNNSQNNLQLVTREQHRKIHHELAKTERICLVCGKKYFSSNLNCTSKFCSSACKSRYKYYNSPNNEIRKCECCGKEFSVPKTFNNRFCSKSCSTTFNNKKKAVEKICPICGKKFTLKYPSVRQSCCSRECGMKFAHNNRKNKK